MILTELVYSLYILVVWFFGHCQFVYGLYKGQYRSEFVPSKMIFLQKKSLTTSMVDPWHQKVVVSKIYMISFLMKNVVNTLTIVVTQEEVSTQNFWRSKDSFGMSLTWWYQNGQEFHSSIFTDPKYPVIRYLLYNLVVDGQNRLLQICKQPVYR